MTTPKPPPRPNQDGATTPPPWTLTPANDNRRDWWQVPGGLWDRKEVRDA